MSFNLYLVGYVVLIAGLALGAYYLNVPARWIIVGVICLVGIAIIHGVSETKHKDPPSQA